MIFFFLFRWLIRHVFLTFFYYTQNGLWKWMWISDNWYCSKSLSFQCCQPGSVWSAGSLLESTEKSKTFRSAIFTRWATFAVYWSSKLIKYSNPLTSLSWKFIKNFMKKLPYQWWTERKYEKNNNQQEKKSSTIINLVFCETKSQVSFQPLTISLSYENPLESTPDFRSNFSTPLYRFHLSPESS